MSDYVPRPILITSLSVPDTYFLTGFCTLPKSVTAEVSAGSLTQNPRLNPEVTYRLVDDPAGSASILLLSDFYLMIPDLEVLDVAVVDLQGNPYKVTTASSKKQGIVDGKGRTTETQAFDHYNPRPFYILDTEVVNGYALKIAGFAMDVYEGEDYSFEFNPLERSIIMTSGGNQNLPQDGAETTVFYLLSEFSFDEGGIFLDRTVLRLSGVNLEYNSSTVVFSPEIVGSNTKPFDNSI